MSNSLSIIRATLDHLDLLAPLFDGYRQFYRQPGDLESARRFLFERLDNDDSVLFLALHDQRGVGFTQLYPAFSSVSMRRLWLLNDLFVDPTARGLGVGETLLIRAQAWALETNAKGLVLETEVTNTTAQHLYEKLGWQREPTSYHYFLNV
jgi:GNAT superfamily N-acetyltransferase